MYGGFIVSFIDVVGDFVLIWVFGYGVLMINFCIDYLCFGIGIELCVCVMICCVGCMVGVVDIDVFDVEECFVVVGWGCYGMWLG